MADSSHKEHPRHAWTVAAAASDWNNDSGTGYDDSFEKEKGPPPRASVERETSGFSVSNMSMTQVDCQLHIFLPAPGCCMVGIHRNHFHHGGFSCC
jgi:hypothetical protein